MARTILWRIAAPAAALALVSAPAQAGKVIRMSAPRLSCAGATPDSNTLQVCGGATGARAGFSIQWMTAADYAANGNAWFSSDDPRLCKASFSGNASLSRYDLGPGECVTVSLGELVLDDGVSTSCPDALVCGTEYVFRSFAHATCALRRSDFTPDLSCSTLACDQGGGCTRPQDYWQFFNPPACSTHPGSPECIEWPVPSLALGAVSYSVEQMVGILNAPVSDNGLVLLAQQLIVAKLNVATGADGSAVAATIAGADGLVAGLVVPPVGDGFFDPSATAAYVTTLTSFNQGTSGPGPCVPPDPGEDDFVPPDPGPDGD